MKMTPQQRKAARKEQWKKMTPQQRAKLTALRKQRRDKWKKMTPEQRKEVKQKKWNKMSPAQRKQQMANEKQNKINSHFIDPDKKGHEQLGEGRRQTTEVNLRKELPYGWHLGHTAEGLVYFWNDSGAKQLHFPAAPVRKRLMNANIT